MSLITVSSRTATLLVTPARVQFTLPAPVEWQLLDSSDKLIAEGVSCIAPLFLEALTPATTYQLRCSAGELTFRTSPCNGLVDAGDYGLLGDQQDNADMFARAIQATPPGGTLFVPEGRHITGPLFLKPDMTLYLPGGCELAAPATRDQWPILPARDKAGRVCGTWEGLPESCFAALVNGIDCSHLTVTGRGIIDGGGDRGDWWSWPKETRNGARRPRTLFLAHSNNVSLSGLTVRNSPSWTIHPYRCSHFTAAALNIQNPPDSPNTDGLNPESCEDVLLSGLDFSVGDDCIAIKSGKRAPDQTDHLAPTRRVDITHCNMARGHGAIVLGSEMSGDITDVTIAHCEFHGTDRGLRIKTRRGRGGLVARIRLTNVSMYDVATPFACNAFYFCDPDGRSEWVQSRQPAPIDHTTPHIDGVSVSHVTARNVSLAAVALLGLPEAPIRNIRLVDFSVSFDPEARSDVPLMALGVDPVRHAGILTTFADVQGELQPLEPNQEPDRC